MSSLKREVSKMNIPTKLACNPLFADKLAEFADEILLHVKKPLVLEAQFFPGGTPLPLISM